MMHATTKSGPVDLPRLPHPGIVPYLLALALLGPLFSPLIGIWGESAKVGSVLWRFGAFGLVVAGQFYVLAALAVAGLAAAALGRRRVLLVLSAATAVLVLLLAVGLPLFVLDFLQLKRIMDPGAFAPFRTTGIKVAAMSVIAIPVLAFVAFYLRRAGKAVEPDIRPRGGPLLAGRP